jgi:ABC-type multidrug transport system fused ATPase/permease subunit
MRWKDSGGRGPGVVRRTGHYFAAFPGTGTGAFLCLVAGGCLALSSPLVLREVVDQGILKGDASRVAVLAAAFLAIEAARTAAEIAQAYLLRKLSHSATGRLREEVFRHLQRLPLSWFESTPTGVIVARACGDVAILGDALSSGMIGLFRDALFTLGAVAVVLILDPGFGAATLGVSLLAAVPAILVRRPVRRLSASALEASARTNAVIEENIAGHAVIQLFGMAPERHDRLRSENENLLMVTKSNLRTRTLFEAAASVASASALALVIGLGGSQLTAGRLSAGLFVAFVQYATNLIGTVRGFSERAVAVLGGIAAGERVFETLDRTEALPASAVNPPGHLPGGALTLTDLRFGYRSGVEVLKGVTSRVERGERVALIGRTGAGKTTLARLLARIYDPWSGRVAWGGRDLREVPAPELRRQAAFVPQQVTIFPGTVLENVRLGDSGIGRTEVVDACREVNAHAFVEALPEGYDTRLFAGGCRISAGQRQLLSLARVLVRRPSLLILDEPTASVDLETEERILAALGRIFQGRTSIVIAHRYSTLRQSDRVWVMDGGRIIREGKPDDLLCGSDPISRLAEQYGLQEREARKGM